MKHVKAFDNSGCVGIPEGVFFGFPCICEKGDYKIVTGLEIDAFSRERLDATYKELCGDRDGVKHLF